VNDSYFEYVKQIGTPTANSHHGQQHRLHKQPECKAANLSNYHVDETCFPWADHVSRSDCGLDFLELAGSGAAVADVGLPEMLAPDPTFTP
jgi:hypothetical protein